MLAKPDTRWGAFGIHLAISAIIFVILAAIIVLAWYPGFLFRTDGGWQGIRLIAGIDLVLGPLLTLIVYNKAKKSLPFDLAVIGAVQISALTIGCWLVYEERPIAVVYADQQFKTMSKNSFQFNAIEPESISLLAQGKKPVWIYAQAEDRMPGESEAAYFQRLGPPHLRTEKYRPLEQHFAELEKYGQKNLPGQEITGNQHLGYHKLRGRYYDGFLLFDHERRELVGSTITSAVNYDGISEG